MNEGEVVTAVASAAHEAWRRRMLNAGWTPGERYDLAQRTHPAVCPFDALPTYWRGQLEQYIGCVCDPSDLVKAVGTVLEEPEWTAADLHVGMRVQLSSEVGGEVGRVVSWVLADPECGAVESILVRWPDGEEVEYTPAEQDLARVT